MVGNKPNYTDVDILRAFLRIDKNTARMGLVKELKLGEGTIRTILNILKNKKLIYSTKNGHSLTERGFKLRERISRELVLIKKMEYAGLYPEQKKFAVLLRGVEVKADYMSLRDIAVKNNANGALIFKFDKTLFVPDSEVKEDFSGIEKEFNFNKNDLLIVSFADNYSDAENGALAIAANLSRELKGLMGLF